MAHQAHSLTLDSAYELYPAALTATTTAGATVFDTGGANVYAKFAVVVDWSACEVASNDELYGVVIEGSTVSGFGTAAAIQRLIQFNFGAKEVTGQGVDTPTSGRKVLFCDNMAHTSDTDGNSMASTRYIRARVFVGGTIASGMNLSVWLIPLP